MSVITLTTDFGSRDWFVGTMKGVIARVAPNVQVVDIAHEIAPGDIRGGAFALAAAAPYFPDGTIHVAIVDPGVGSERRAIALDTKNAIFIGPDNGVLSWAVRDVIKEAREISNSAWFLQPVSHTFHGRDVSFMGALYPPRAGSNCKNSAFQPVGVRRKNVAGAVLVKRLKSFDIMGLVAIVGCVRDRIHVDSFGSQAQDSAGHASAA